MLKRIIDWFLPTLCVVCQQVNSNYFCQSCLEELPWLINSCLLCAKEIVSVQDLMICGECLIDPPPFEKNIALFKYEFPIVSLITQLKFRKQLLIAKALGTLLVDKLAAAYRTDALPQCVIPVPLHKKRLGERGYNQALEIARSIEGLGIKLEFKKVKRVLATKAQTLIELEQRRKNVANAFVVEPDFDYQHVAVLDDVVTTGSTVEEIARVLKKRGVRRIDLWCIARARS